MAFCKNCGQSNESGAAVCMSCGFAAGQGQNNCQNCGAKINPGAAICTSCGANVQGAYGSVNYIPGVPVQSQNVFCKNCGKSIDPNAAVCMSCGFSVGTGQSYCAGCGKEAIAGASMCTGCGRPLQGSGAYAYASGGKPPKSKLTAGLLGIFLGTFGVHNFYLGKTTTAIIQVCVGGLGILLSCLIFPLFATLGISIWGLVEGIMILTGRINTDGQGNPLGD